MAFTTDEKAIIQMYLNGNTDKERLLEIMQRSLPFVDTKEIADLISSTIRKVKALSDEKFEQLDLSNALDLYFLDDEEKLKK